MDELVDDFVTFYVAGNLILVALHITISIIIIIALLLPSWPVNSYCCIVLRLSSHPPQSISVLCTINMYKSCPML